MLRAGGQGTWDSASWDAAVALRRIRNPSTLPRPPPAARPQMLVTVLLAVAGSTLSAALSQKGAWGGADYACFVLLLLSLAAALAHLAIAACVQLAAAGRPPRAFLRLLLMFEPLVSAAPHSAAPAAQPPSRAPTSYAAGGTNTWPLRAPLPNPRPPNPRRQWCAARDAFFACLNFLFFGAMIFLFWNAWQRRDTGGATAGDAYKMQVGARAGGGGCADPH